MNIAINASRAKSGGGIRHIKGIIEEIDEEIIEENNIHIWSYKNLLDKIVATKNIKKHSYFFSNYNLFFQIFWEYFILPIDLRKNKIDILINVDAGSFCYFKPSISISRDMLPFEPEVTRNFGFIYKLRNKILKFTHISSLNNAIYAIFLTNYAAETIKPFLKKDLQYQIIPHGVDSNFFLKKTISYPKSNSSEIIITYVSPCLPYKNHAKVIEAIFNLRKKNNLNLKLQIIGQVTKYSKKELFSATSKFSFEDKFVEIKENIKQNEIPNILRDSHIFLFASSCENMPNSLLEGMASGLPIVCSNVGSMPEILKDGGVYFNPIDVESIEKALEKLILDEENRKAYKNCSKKLAYNYSWKKTSKKTFETAIKAFYKYKKN